MEMSSPCLVYGSAKDSIAGDVMMCCGVRSENREKGDGRKEMYK
jgi:hypothetical protein